MTSERPKDGPPNPGNRCLVCQEVVSRRTRGLCETHYQQFRREREQLPKEQWSQFEELLVSNGLLLPSQQGVRPVSLNVFAEARLKLQAETAAEAATEQQAADELAEQLIADEEQLRAKGKRKRMKP